MLFNILRNKYINILRNKKFSDKYKATEIVIT